MKECGRPGCRSCIDHERAWGGLVGLLMIVGICLRRLRRTSSGKCDGIPSSGMGAVHLACRLARRSRPYETGEFVGISSMNLYGYGVRVAGRRRVVLFIGSSSSSGDGCISASARTVTNSRLAGDAGYPAASVILS